MPDVATTRERTVSISGTGGFGIDTAVVHSPTDSDILRRVTWNTASGVSYWGTETSATVSIGGALRREEGAAPASTVTPTITLTLTRGGYSKSVTVSGTPYTPTTSAPPLSDLQQYWDVSTGTFGFTEVAHCVQHFNPDPYEARTPVSFTASASIAVHFVDTLGGGTQTISASLTMTDADISGFTSGTYDGYGYAYGFNGCPVSFGNSATLGFDSPGLMSTLAGISAGYGLPGLTASGTGASFQWGGSATDINYQFNPDAADANPTASVQFYPSWAMAVESQVLHYEDASEVGATIDHMYGPSFVGSFTSGGGYRYPGGGLIHWGQVQMTSGQALQDVGGGTITEVGMQWGWNGGGPYSNPNPAVVQSGFDLGPIGLLLQKPGMPAGGVTQFLFNPVWADDYGTYANSGHPVPPAMPIVPKYWQPYQAGTITWADSYKFALFEDTGPNTKLTADVAAGDTDLPVVSTMGFTIGDAIGIGAEGLTLTGIPGPDHLTVTPTGIDHAKGTQVLREYLGAHEGSRWQGGPPYLTFTGTTSTPDPAPSVHLIAGGAIDGNAVEIVTLGQTAVTTSNRYLLLHQAYRYARLKVSAAPLSTTLTADVSAGDTDLPVLLSDGFQVADKLIIDPYGTPEAVTVSAVAEGHLTVGELTADHASAQGVSGTVVPKALFALDGSAVGTIGWMLEPPATKLTAAAATGAAVLTVSSSKGFVVGDRLDIEREAAVPGLPPEQVTVSAIAPGHLTVSALVHDHAAGQKVSIHPGGFRLYELDLARPQWEVPLGASTWRRTARIVHPDKFVPQTTTAQFGATTLLQVLSAGTVVFDYLEGYIRTDGDRPTPRLFFPFLDGYGDSVDMEFYEGHYPERPLPVDSDTPIQWMAWMVNGVRGATVRPLAPASIEEKWDYLVQWFDSAADNPQSVTLGFPHRNDTGIHVLPGVAGDPDPLSVFGPNNQEQFTFNTVLGYGLTGPSHILHGQLRPTQVAAYYGCGDLATTSGGYEPAVVFQIDWVLDGEVIMQRGKAGEDLELHDNDTDAVLDTATTDDDGMARLHAKYGVVHPNSNIDGEPLWSEPVLDPIETSLTAVVLVGDTDMPVADETGFEVGFHINVGTSLQQPARVTAVSPGHIFITPGVSAVLGPGELVVFTPPHPPLDYTPTGLQMNAYWIPGADKPPDTAGVVYPENFPVLDRYQTIVTALARIAAGVWNMHDRLGGYHRADVAEGVIRYHRSDLSLPPFVIEVDATDGPDDSEPRMSPSGMDRVHLLFTRGSGDAGDVMLTWSDDDGATWSEPMALFAGGRHPANAPTDIGTVIHAAYVDGNIQAKEEFAPEQWSEAWTFVDAAATAIGIDDDSFSFTLAKEGAARHVLVATAGGDVSEWVSADDGRTWSPVTP